jgi:hypothetical protein
MSYNLTLPRALNPLIYALLLHMQAHAAVPLAAMYIHK